MKPLKEKLLSFYRKNKRMPSLSEIMKMTGYKTKSAVSYALQKLIDDGVVSKDKTGKLIPKNIADIRVLGVVEAGFPSPSEEELADTLSIDEYLVEKREATYILTVKGDSMMDAGILEGDMVLVERGAEYKDGDIIIAEIDGEWTIKYFRKKKGVIFLEPANVNYPPLYPTQELIVSAVVRAVIRKY